MLLLFLLGSSFLKFLVGNGFKSRHRIQLDFDLPCARTWHEGQLICSYQPNSQAQNDVNSQNELPSLNDASGCV